MKHEDVVRQNIAAIVADEAFQLRSLDWIRESAKHSYSYNFSWMGRPIIQYPQDIVAMQELIWTVKPDLIIETGIAHGGSLVFSASMLTLLDVSDSMGFGKPFDPKVARRKVIGIDIEIREHNRRAVEQHPLAPRIQMIEGSSIDPLVIETVRAIAAGCSRILVCLDSNHTHEHVLAELEAYAPLVNVGSFCVVFDTVVEGLPSNMFANRPWAPGNSPMTAVRQFLGDHPEFVVDESIHQKLQITVAPNGYLRRVG